MAADAAQLTRVRSNKFVCLLAKEINMLLDYLRVLAEVCNKDFQEMTGCPVVSVTVKREERLAESYALGMVVPFSDEAGSVEGQLIMGFGEERLAALVASSIGQQLKLGPYEEIDDQAKDVLAEFMKIVAGHTVIAWEGLGLAVKFEPPQVIEETTLPTYAGISSESYVLILTLTFGWMVFNVKFFQSTTALAGKKILVADGSMLSRALLKNGLEQLGFEVSEAGEGAQAVEAFGEDPPDLLITELILPGMPGLEAMAAIRQKRPTARFIVVSPGVSPEDREQCFDLGASAVLDKPVKVDELIDAVKKALTNGA